MARAGGQAPDGAMAGSGVWPLQAVRLSGRWQPKGWRLGALHPALEHRLAGRAPRLVVAAAGPARGGHGRARVHPLRPPGARLAPVDAHLRARAAMAVAGRYPPPRWPNPDLNSKAPRRPAPGGAGPARGPRGRDPPP